MYFICILYIGKEGQMSGETKHLMISPQRQGTMCV